jgi:biopolymer transport protein ExbD
MSLDFRSRARMDFRSSGRNEPEINLIPFIDVLLVVLIFLMLSTTYSRLTEMQLRLPVADTETQRDYPKEVQVTVAADGRTSVNGQVVTGRGVGAVSDALTSAAKAGPQTVVVISADASAAHQNVITVMEAARRSGLAQITFATQSSAGSNQH